MENPKPVLGVTMGDATGAGPEIMSKAWATEEVRGVCRMVAVGDAATIEKAFRITGVSGRVRPIAQVEEACFDDEFLDVIDLKNIDPSKLVYARVLPMAGKAAYECVERSIRLALDGEIDAIVTSALHKEALNLAGYHFAGHTEILAHLTGTKSVTMMLTCDDFRVTHVSTHCSLREAIERVRKPRIMEVLRLTSDAVQQMGVADPRLAVAGLNPHAGEGGLFGAEESLEIGPAIDEARAMGMNVYHCPLPPDTVFYRMMRGQFDAVVAMYHDQGHIPTKMLGFERGVNVTLGLPIIRTSVDHGTVYGKAGKGTADATSLIEALKLAAVMVAGRQRT